MEKPIFENTSGLWVWLFSFLGFAVLFFVVLLCGEFLGAVVLGVVAVFLLVLFIKGKHNFFTVILVNENGIGRYYKNTILEEIKWEEITEAKIVRGNGRCPYFIELYKKDKIVHPYEGEKYKVVVGYHSPAMRYLHLYKDKIPVEMQISDDSLAQVKESFKK